MLVGAFEVEVGMGAGVAFGAQQIWPFARVEHEGVGAAAVEPHVENVCDAFVILDRVIGSKIFCGARLVPRVHTFGADGGDDAGVDGWVGEVLATLAVDKQRDRHTPCALAAQHPIGAAFDHRADAVAALFGHPTRVGDRAHGGFAQGFACVLVRPDRGFGGAQRRLAVDRLVHRHEPLRRAAIDHLCLRAPRVGVGMLVIGGRCEQPARLAQSGADRAIGRVEFGVDDRAFAAQPSPIGAIFAIALNRKDRLDAVGLAQREVVLAMVGRHVDEAGAALGGDEITGQEGARFGEEGAVGEGLRHGVAGEGAGEVGAFACPNPFA